MGALNIRISIHGMLSESVWQELEGFSDHPMADGQVLIGTVPDQAALVGVLQRLHLAGVVVDDIEQLEEFPDSGRGEDVARIQVDGRVADYLAREQWTAHLVEQVTTTIEVRVTGQEELFELLSQLEALAVNLKEAHIRPGRPFAAR